jgi:hypothetical protein
MTQDVDIVVENEALANHLDSFLELLERSDFLFDRRSVRRAAEKRDMFPLFGKAEALKLDVYPRELIAGELDRSCLIEVLAEKGCDILKLLIHRLDRLGLVDPRRLPSKFEGVAAHFQRKAQLAVV